MMEQCGTPAYIAPEIFKNKGYRGYGSDIWSAGVVLYTMLYGAMPFKANNIAEQHKQVTDTEPVYKEEISKEAIDLLKGILEKDPTKRFGAAEIL
jgi:5'-AMP-activated protein kinase, catalytic alpha subunit